MKPSMKPITSQKRFINATGPIGLAMLTAFGTTSPTQAQTAGTAVSKMQGRQAVELPQPVPMPPRVEEPKDKPFLGDITLHVDATDVTHRIFQVRESLPVQGGATMTFLFPQWTTGDHTPNGPLEKMAGLKMTAGGQRLHWVRDSVQVYAFHVDIPRSADKLELEYQYLGGTDRRSGAILITPTMLDLQWQTVVLYPAGYYSRDIRYQPTLTLPQGWSYASALDGAQEDQNRIVFPEVTLDTLVDSPVMAGKYFKQVNVSNEPVPVRLDIVADSTAGLEGTANVVQAYASIVNQAYKLFGSHHYNHYDFMLWLSNDFGPVYYEHQRSGENSAQSAFLKTWTDADADRAMMVHGYVHSWNGTFLRPAEMWTPNFNVPERDAMLWVFEGLTMYWGDVLAARANLMTRQDFLDTIADLAGRTSTDIGAEWRPLQDVNNDPLIAFRRPITWSTWQRNMFDAYYQGEMIWLNVDTIIRQQTHGKKSLDDFASNFFGRHDGSFTTETYSFADMVDALNAITPFDWSAFLHSQLEDYAPGASLDGIVRSGYKLTFIEVPLAPEGPSSPIDLTFSSGMIVNAKGGIMAVHWGGPAFNAGAIPNETIVSVNGGAFSPDALRSAVKNTETGGPLELVVQNGVLKETLTVKWSGGLRYPHLEPIPGKDAFLDGILTAIQ